MKRIFFLTLFLIPVLISSGQTNSRNDSVVKFFQELKANTLHYKELWNTDLYGPVLLVDPATRNMISNFPDSEGVLKKDGEIFTGKLPDNLNIANTSVTWNGRMWAMVMLPLPADRQERLDLLTHELFHRSQTVIGFHITNSDNNHLDKRDGRVYTRLELEALKKALASENRSEFMDHLANAFYFRKTRNSLFPGSERDENILELNEGLAAYTGIIMSGRNEREIKNYFEKKISEFQTYPTFVRSFAYLTTPLYGFLLQPQSKNWNKFISDSTNLTGFFIKAFGISVPQNLCHECLSNYGAEKIISEETEREKENEQRIASYRKIFIDQSHLVIGLQKTNISFDPRNIVPLEGYGTVYPSMRITDNWGILTVTGGALLSTNWDKVILSEPTSIVNEKISGNGWTLELNNGFSVEKNTSDGNYILKKN